MPGATRPVTNEREFQTGLRRVRSVLQQYRSDDLNQLRASSIEWVFGLTGQAGSCMYMAPEVFRKLPYNQKADVFSFGILMYELLSRELLIIAYFNTHKAEQMGWKAPEDYAEAVCNGYRPPLNKVLTHAQWDLICRCWHDDPIQRPSMAEVADELKLLLQEEQEQPGQQPGCACVIS